MECQFGTVQFNKGCDTLESITANLVPDVDATYSLGTALKRFNTLYLSSFASIGDGIRFTGATSYIRNSTSDAADSAELVISGGGAAGATRGADISAFGNEHATTPGRVIIQSGNVASTGINLITTNSTSNIDFRINSTIKWKFTGDDLTYSIVGAKINAATTAGADNSQLDITGGGLAVVASGSFISLFGNENAATGRLDLSGGEAATSHINLITNNAAACVIVKINAAETWRFTTSNLQYNSTTTDILSSTADATDNAVLRIAGGGAVSSTRGGYIQLAGNEHAQTGALTLTAGSTTTGHINLVTTNSSAEVAVKIASAQTWKFSGATLTNDATNGGNLIFTKAGTGLVDTVGHPSGAGTTQGTGTAITNFVNYITVLTAASAEAFVLPTAVPGTRIWITNLHATDAAKIFPATGAQIAPGGGAANGAANAVYSLAALKNAVFFAVTTTQWAVIVT